MDRARVERQRCRAARRDHRPQWRMRVLMLTTGPGAATGAATAAGAAAGPAITVDWFRMAMAIAIIIIVLLLLLLLLLLERLASEVCSAVSCWVTWSLLVVPPMT